MHSSCRTGWWCSTSLQFYLGGDRFQQNMRIASESFENVAEFKHVRTTLTNQNDIRDEIKSRLNLGNVYYHSVQNLLSSRLISKNLKIKI
jgi:hypothetical protein